MTRDDAARIHFREHDYYRRFGRSCTPPQRRLQGRPGFDENAEILRRGHEAGVPGLPLRDDLRRALARTQDWAWPWDPTGGWLSDYVRDHPEHVLVDARRPRATLGRPRLQRRCSPGVPRPGDPRRSSGARLGRRVRVHPLAVEAGAPRRPVRLQRAESSRAVGAIRRGGDPAKPGPDADLDAWREVRGEGLTRSCATSGP